MRTRRLATLAAAAALAAPVGSQFADAQTPETVVEELGEARRFAPGTLDAASGGLDAGAWTGTAAATAERLIRELPTEWTHPLAEQLALSALLSGGVPPEGEAEGEAEWRVARANWLLRSGRADAVEALSARDPELARDERLRTELQLSTGRLTDACLTADVREEGRGEPFWARLRAVCHLQRNETAAAELTAELAGGGDEVFGTLFRAKLADGPRPDVEPRAPIHRALLGLWDADASADSLLSDMADLEISALRRRMEEREGDAIADLYLAAVDTKTAEAVAEFLRAAEARANAVAASRHLAPVIARIPAEDAAEHLDVFTRSAVLREDLSALAELFRAGGGSERVALVSDALGGGFQLRPLGESVDARLADGKGFDDAVVGLALGARLSPEAAEALEGAELSMPEADAGELLVLRAVAASGARAETALRASAVLNASSDTATAAEVIRALRLAGLERQARQVGAWELARGD